MKKNVRNYALVFLLTCTLNTIVQAHLQSLPVPSNYFGTENALIFLVENKQMNQSFAGMVPLDASKTFFARDEYTLQTVASVNNVLSLAYQQQNPIILPENSEQKNRQDHTNLVYLRFETYDQSHIVKAIVIQNSLLADSPFEVVSFAVAISDDEDDDFSFDDFNEPAVCLSPAQVQQFEQHAPSSMDMMKIKMQCLMLYCSEQFKNQLSRGVSYVKSVCQKRSIPGL